MSRKETDEIKIRKGESQGENVTLELCSNDDFITAE
jgi:hypothetical protein